MRATRIARRGTAFLLAALAGAACTADRPGRGGGPASAGRALYEGPEEMRDLRATLNRLAAARDARDAAAARALFPEVLSDGKNALSMAPPHDLKRHDVPTFLEGRANFSDAINAFGRAANGGPEAEVWEAAARLETSFSAWWDAYRGQPCEGGV